MLFLEIMLPILFFILGVCLASFGNVLICRYPNWKVTDENVFSKCPKCNHRLMWYDLVPIFSFIFLKGKCRYCHEKISPRYIIVETIGGVLMLLTYFMYAYVFHQSSSDGSFITNNFGFSLDVLNIFNVVCISLSLLVLFIGSFIDKEHKEIPLSFSIMLFALALLNWAVDFIVTKNYMLMSLLGLAIPFGFFLIIYLICTLAFKTEPIGLGDIIVYCSLGFLMGIIQFVIILLISTVVCSIVEIIKIKKTKKKEQIPFIPYIFLGFVVSAFAGEFISNGYLMLIGVK